MKKKLLFVTLYLQTGGVEKSLLSVLSSLDYDKYDVDLCLFDHSGLLFHSIPREVNVLPPAFEHFSTPLAKAIPLLLKRRKFRLACAKVLAACISKITKSVRTGARWSIYRLALPKLAKHYDVAISYLDFFCNYYVTEKVHADKKIVYNHMNYVDGQKNGWPCPKLERKSFAASDYVVSVAETAKEALISYFPEMRKKIYVIHNTVSQHIIKAQSQEYFPAEYSAHRFNVLTVARLVEEKGVALAVDACKILINQGMAIRWCLIGKGQLFEELNVKIQSLGLKDHFLLLGEIANPYPYMALCDVYVQPSKTEAHCVAVEEAMALKKPIVATDIPSFRDQIINNQTGLIVPGTALGISEGIMELYQSNEMRGQLSANLMNIEERNKKEISKLYYLIEGSQALVSEE